MILNRPEWFYSFTIGVPPETTSFWREGTKASLPWWIYSQSVEKRSKHTRGVHRRAPWGNVCSASALRLPIRCKNIEGLLLFPTCTPRWVYLSRGFHSLGSAPGRPQLLTCREPCLLRALHCVPRGALTAESSAEATLQASPLSSVQWAPGTVFQNAFVELTDLEVAEEHHCS